MSFCGGLDVCQILDWCVPISVVLTYSEKEDMCTTKCITRAFGQFRSCFSCCAFLLSFSFFFFFFHSFFLFFFSQERSRDKELIMYHSEKNRKSWEENKVENAPLPLLCHWPVDFPEIRTMWLVLTSTKLDATHFATPVSLKFSVLIRLNWKRLRVATRSTPWHERSCNCWTPWRTSPYPQGWGQGLGPQGLTRTWSSSSTVSCSSSTPGLIRRLGKRSVCFCVSSPQARAVSPHTQTGLWFSS